MALGNFEILESYRFFINPKLLCGNREGVLGKSCLGRGGGRQVVCFCCCQKRWNFLFNLT